MTWCIKRSISFLMLKLILELKVRREDHLFLLWGFWSLFWLIVNSAHEILREIGTIWIKSRPTYYNKLSRASRREKKKNSRDAHSCLDSGWISTVTSTFINISRIQVWCYKIDPPKKIWERGKKIGFFFFFGRRQGTKLKKLLSSTIRLPCILNQVNQLSLIINPFSLLF